MQVRFLQNLGLLDIRALKDKHGIELKAADCKIGSVVDIPSKAFDVLSGKYKAVVEAVNVKGEAKKPEITAPAK